MATATVTTASTRVLNIDLSVENKNEEVKKHHVSTVINYYRDPGDGSPPEPVRISDKTVKNERPMIAKPTTIYDVTGDEGKYTLDGNGFQFLTRGTRLRGADFHDTEVVKTRYYLEAEALLKDVTGASRIHIFDHKTRVGPSNWHRLGEGNRAARGPLFRAHVDQSYAGAEIVLRRHFPAEEVDELLAKGVRWQIINVWRPIKPIRRDPLAVADAHSIAEEDLVAALILYRDGSHDETWTILPPSSSSNSAAGGGTGEEGHKWYYKRAQKPDEALLIKCFDSATRISSASPSTKKLARRAPHSAFVDPAFDSDPAKDGEGKEENGPRESIELRALVLYD